MGCGGSREEDDAAMVEAIGVKPKQPVPKGDAMSDALREKKYQVELRAYNKRLAKWEQEAPERKTAAEKAKAEEKAKAADKVSDATQQRPPG
jgi:hypothetical protein